MNEQQKINRSDADVRAGISVAVNAGQITQEQGEEIFWLHTFARDNRKSNDDIARLIGKSKTAVSQVFSGKYGAEDWSGLISAISTFRKREQKRVRGLDVGFIQTDTSRLIFRVCDNALNDEMPAFIYGASQLGKTRALEEYVRRANSASVKYFRCRSGMTHLRFAREFAKSCHLKCVNSKSAGELIDEVAKSFDPSCLIIIDEFHLCFETVRQDASKRLIEYIREIYDLSKCGLVLCSTKVGLADLEEGPNRLLFDQLRRRGIIKLVLPDVPSIKDINLFSAAFKLSPPTGDDLAFVKELLESRGLNVFLAYLRKADGYAHNLQRPLEWADFLSVARGFEKLSFLKADY